VSDHRHDSELVAAALSGCDEAFAELVDRYRRAVYGAAFHYVGDFEDARDVAQEAVVQAYLHLRTLRDPERFGHWLYGIAKAAALNFIRSRRREVPLDGSSLAESAELHVERDAEHAEQAQLVRRALAALSEPTRLAVILHHVGGYSQSEIAGFLGTTRGAVRTRLSRARRRLRKEMMDMMGENLHDAAEKVRFEEQFLSGVIAAMRAFGPLVADRISGAGAEWMEDWARRAQTAMAAGTDELMAWQLSLGKGRYHRCTGSVAYVSEIPDHDPALLARVADAFASSERVRLMQRLVRGPATLQQLLDERAAAENALEDDIKLLREIGALEQIPDGELRLTHGGAQALCGLTNIFLYSRFGMPEDGGAPQPGR
jgi:RNA polymerase sigma-70 factor (ECF subfamily)